MTVVDAALTPAQRALALAPLAPPLSPPRLPAPARPARPRPARAAAATPATVEGSPASPAQGAAPAPAGDTPRHVTLLPGTGLDLGVTPEAPGGRTLHNDGTEPDPHAVAEAAGRLAQARVQGFALDDLAVARVEKGLVDPAYGDFRRTLDARLAAIPKAVHPSTDKERTDALLGAMLPAMQRYGATGQPYDTPPGWRAENDVPAALQRAADTGHPAMVALAQKLQATARLKDFADGRMGHELRLIIDITPLPPPDPPRVTLVSSELPKPLGDWAVQQATALLAAPDAGLPEGKRSRWLLTGRTEFYRPVSTQEAPRVTLATALMAALSAVLPNAPNAFAVYDEVLGEMKVFDPSNPTYVLHATLMAVY